jgi:hydroxymethylpyrimidine/phosphomethylpyrimidine kinase
MFRTILMTFLGMMASTEAISTVAAALKDHNVKTVVVDPVSIHHTSFILTTLVTNSYTRSWSLRLAPSFFQSQPSPP